MKKLRTSFKAKLAAVIICAVLTAVFSVSLTAVATLYSDNYYFDQGQTALKNKMKQIAVTYCNTIVDDYYPLVKNSAGHNTGAVERYENSLSKGKSNFSFTLTDEDGKELLSNFALPAEEAIITASEEYPYESYDESGMLKTAWLTVVYSVRNPVLYGAVVKDDYYYAQVFIQNINSIRHLPIAALIISGIPLLVCFVFLIYSVGIKQSADGTIKSVAGNSEKIPIDLSVVIFAAICCLPILTNSIGSATAKFIGSTVAAFICIDLGGLLTLLLAMRVRIGPSHKRLFIYRVYKRYSSSFAKLFAAFGMFLNNIPFIWKTVIALVTMSFAELFCLLIFSHSMIMALWFVEKLIVCPIVLFIAVNIYTIKSGVDKIADGDIDYKVDTRYLIWDFRKYGESLNNISGSMHQVVDQRMKSERMKTELITNVSHDIKTPLTSIVTYVDLLKNSDNLPDELTDYVDVLDRSGKKLTKLVNDLVDASQASAGSIKVSMQSGDAGVMLTQAAAEYDERLKAAGLTPVVTAADESLIIMADGRLLWRVFDNLLSNICKYSLPNTRVYMKADEKNGKVRISFSNISKCPLNVSADELLERFVRGDSSRNTEGSGLGLSIAQSLISLQGGTLSLDIDGDLFKATIEFDKVK